MNLLHHMHRQSLLITEANGVLFGVKLYYLKLLQSSCCSKHPCFNIIQEIHAVHKNDESISWKHVLREGN